MNQRVLVTGWAGFIGTNLVRRLLTETGYDIYGLDAMTYAAAPDWATDLAESKKEFKSRFTALGDYDICDSANCFYNFRVVKPDIVIHLAAETHVCRSIDGPRDFIQTNIVGTYNLLEATRRLSDEKKVIFHHVSTDEVFGELGPDGYFTENSPYNPRSPYAASKASSDHLVKAWRQTYGLDTRISNCSNNFGPNQHEEKLIPKTIRASLQERPFTIYGPGSQVRDWIWVDDHTDGVIAAIGKGEAGSQFLFGGRKEMSNIEMVSAVWDAMDFLAKDRFYPKPFRKLEITNGRPTDDRRYAINCSKASFKLGWVPRADLFQERLIETVKWYLENRKDLV